MTPWVPPLSARVLSRDLSHDRMARSRDNTRAERGGDPLRHRSRDTSFIGGEMCARVFFAYSTLDINCKGVHMKLKIVGLEISVE